MNTEELMRPRYKVIADYPGGNFSVNDILTYKERDGRNSGDWWTDEKSKDTVYHPEEYPHLFKPLAWYEDREASEMPEYLKTDKEWSAISVNKVKSFYGDDNEYVEFEDTESIPEQCDPNQYCTEWFEPATESDYLQYINNQKSKQ